MAIYARSLDENNIRAASNFHSLQRMCPTDGIPLVEALTRKEMSRIVNKFPYVGVIGILDYEGFENEFIKIVRKWRETDSFKLFHTDQASILP